MATTLIQATVPSRWHLTAVLSLTSFAVGGRRRHGGRGEGREGWRKYSHSATFKCLCSEGTHHFHSHSMGQSSATWPPRGPEAGTCPLYSSGHMSPAKTLLQWKTGRIGIGKSEPRLSGQHEIEKRRQSPVEERKLFVPSHQYHWTLGSVLPNWN